nr:MAG TPA: 4Fe-4S dicluster domain protein [Caudoviricetes sp.]
MWLTQEEARAAVQATESPHKTRRGVCRHSCP